MGYIPGFGEMSLPAVATAAASSGYAGMIGGFAGSAYNTFFSTGDAAAKNASQLQQIFDDPKLFLNWLKGNKSLTSTPLAQAEVDQLVANANRLGLQVDKNAAGVAGLEKTGQWAGVPHFKIGNVHIPIQLGVQP
jgi:hypothetical protein